MTDEEQIDGVTHAEKDANGNIVHNPDVVNTGGVDIAGSDLVSDGDFVGIGPTLGTFKETFSTTSTSYVSDTSFMQHFLQWSNWAPDGAQTAVYFSGRFDGSTGDVRYRNFTDAQNIIVQTGVSAGTNIGEVVNYEPATTTSSVSLAPEIRTSDGGTASELKWLSVLMGVQV